MSAPAGIRRSLAFAAWFPAALLALGCSPGTGATTGTGGSTAGSGGAVGTSSGGATGSGGNSVSGGATGSGGGTSSGGSSGTATGGAAAGSGGAGTSSGGSSGATGGTTTGGSGPASGGAGAGAGSSSGGRGGAAGTASGGRGGGAQGGNAGSAGGGGATTPTGPVVLSDDGGWCWFEHPRAIFQNGKLIIGSVASGWNNAARKGDIEVIVHDLAARTTMATELHNQLELDDHDSPAFLVRPDGRLLALYAKHGSENHFYYRLSNANAPNTWAAEQTFAPTAGTELTYSNLFILPAEQNRIYDFYRGLDASYKPSYAYSDDMGASWKNGNIVINVPSTQKHRPYARYVSNGTDTVHITYTEAHPRDFDNSIYHVYYKGGSLYRSDGTAIHTLAQGLSSPDEGTRIYQGNANNVAWTSDVVLDPANGRPHTVYTVQLNSAGLPTGQGGTDMRYRYARWDGTAWRDHALAYAGTRLYSGEDDYTGLAVLDPTNASVVYLSTNANPATGVALTSSADSKRHWEIFRGNTTNAGDTWTWTAITSNSTLDNLRPVIVNDGAGQKALLWLRGTYRSYTDYQQQVLALFWRE